MPAPTNVQYHQIGSYIHVLIQEANVRAEDLDVQIQRRRLTVELGRGAEKAILIEGLLHGQVDVGNSKTKIHNDHILIKLRKMEEAMEWPQLMLSGGPTTGMSTGPVGTTSLQRASQHVLVSPESSPTRTVQWNPMEKNLLHTPKHMAEAGVDRLNSSLSNLVHKVLHHGDEEKRDEEMVI